MIELLISLVILLVVGGLIWYLLTLLPLPAPIKTVIQVCGILILILVLLYYFIPALPIIHR